MKRPGILSKVQMLNLVLGVGVFFPSLPTKASHTEANHPNFLCCPLFGLCISWAHRLPESFVLLGSWISQEGANVHFSNVHFQRRKLLAKRPFL